MINNSLSQEQIINQKRALQISEELKAIRNTEQRRALIEIVREEALKRGLKMNQQDQLFEIETTS